MPEPYLLCLTAVGIALLAFVLLWQALKVKAEIAHQQHEENMAAIKSSEEQQGGVRAWAHKEGLAQAGWMKRKDDEDDPEPETDEEFSGVVVTVPIISDYKTESN